MNKHSLQEIIQIKSIIQEDAIVVDMISKQNIIIYQVKVVNGVHKDKLFWFAEHEVCKK